MTETTTRRGQQRSTLLRYREKDTMYGVTKNTARRLARLHGLNETQLLHSLLAQAAARDLPRYQPDDGPISDAAWKQVMAHAPKKLGKVRSSIID